MQLPDHGYRVYIESLFDEIGREVRVLFDRRDPASLLWPRRQALLDLVGILNGTQLSSVWVEDETIGWVYQYFNSDDERRQMRAENPTPRNSRELAVRNQFFTPHYVVRFLTDNTVGRVWYEMRQGDTRLRDLDCLVRRANETFLTDGEEPPPDVIPSDADMKQEEMLRRPLYVPFRPKKDPRDIRVLDPACGSGHFLLYAFDLLLAIYEEGWADDGSPVSEVTGQSLRDDYPEVQVLRAAMPGLILRHNLHGIDIDARCAQIGALALWTRAQRAFKQYDIPRYARPPIAKTNIVVAEPMPGGPVLRQDFVATLEPKLRQLVERVFEQMELAGEAGPLLRIEDRIRDVVRGTLGEHGELFRASDNERWQRAERDVLRALPTYTERAVDGASFQRRLFAEDTARGLGFIRLSQLTYDAIVMNPPFGDVTSKVTVQLSKDLKRSGNDIGAAFVDYAASRLAAGGALGVLLSTGPWFKPVFEKWRTRLFFGDDTSVRVAAHLGGEVLDGATVSASPFVVSRGRERPCAVFRHTRSDDLETDLLDAIGELASGSKNPNTLLLLPSSAAFLPGKPFCYWVSPTLRKTLSTMPPFEGTGGEVRTGLQTSDEPRFCRAWWEVPVDDMRWLPYSKSSPYSPFWDDYTWVELVGDDLREVSAFAKSKVQGIGYFLRPGVTYPSKSVLGFNARLHPKGCGFAHSGCVAFPKTMHPLGLLMFLSSRPVEYLISLYVGDLQGRAGVHPNQYEVGIVQRLPWPTIESTTADRLVELGARCVSTARDLNAFDETTHDFSAAVVDYAAGLDENFQALVRRETAAVWALADCRAQADSTVLECYGFSESDVAILEEAFSERVPPAKGRWRAYFGESGTDIDRESFNHRVVSWLMGIAMGRWKNVEVGMPPEHSPDTLIATPQNTSPALLGATAGGVLVDDPGHLDDVCARLAEALEHSKWEISFNEL